jgi:hypothetical protein
MIMVLDREVVPPPWKFETNIPQGQSDNHVFSSIRANEWKGLGRHMEGNPTGRWRVVTLGCCTRRDGSTRR